jgi:hypothetical protein
MRKYQANISRRNEVRWRSGRGHAANSVRREQHGAKAHAAAIRPTFSDERPPLIELGSIPPFAEEQVGVSSLSAD